MKAIVSLIAQILTCAVCVVVGWILKDNWPQEKPAANPMAAMAGLQQTVAVTNVELRAYNKPERFVAHAEPVQEVDLLPQVDGYIQEITRRATPSRRATSSTSSTTSATVPS